MKLHVLRTPALRQAPVGNKETGKESSMNRSVDNENDSQLLIDSWDLELEMAIVKERELLLNPDRKSVV